MTKGEQLNQRVWKLFQRAGFSTKPSDQSSAEHDVMLGPKKPRPVDLYAEDKDLKIKIIGSNKSGTNVKPFSGHIVDYHELGKKEKASTVLFVVTAKEVSAPDRELIAERKMVLWGQRELDYYDALTEALGSFAKFEIIRALGLKTKEEQDTHHLLALRLHQPTDEGIHEMYIFSTTPDRLLKTSFVFRRASNNADAYQRMLQAKRLPGIAKFVAKESALLPTNIILKLGPKVSVDEVAIDELKDSDGKSLPISSSHCDIVRLNLPMAYGSLELIDGQHRLFAFTKTEPATRSSFNLVVLGLRHVSEKQERDAFLAINDNAKRVDPNLVAYLRYEPDVAKCQADPALMAIRVVVDMSDRPLFKGMIRLLDSGPSGTKITLKGFSGYDLKGLVGSSGALRNLYSENTPDKYITALEMYFSAVRDSFYKEWKDPDTYIVATNRGVSAFLKLYKSLIRLHAAEIDYATAKEYLEPLAKNFKTWETSKLKSNYVGSQGWKSFHRDMVAAIKKEYSALKA